MKAVVAAFNQEKALVGAFSVITNLRMDLFESLYITRYNHLAVATAWQKPVHLEVRNHREGPSRAFSWLKAATTAFTFKTLLRHYAKRALTPRSLNVKLGPRRNYHKGRAAKRHYANQTARPL